MEIELHKKKRRHRTATTAYPCFLPDLGDSAGAGRAAGDKGKANFRHCNTPTAKSGMESAHQARKVLPCYPVIRVPTSFSNEAIPLSPVFCGAFYCLCTHAKFLQVPGVGSSPQLDYALF